MVDLEKRKRFISVVFEKHSKEPFFIYLKNEGFLDGESLSVELMIDRVLFFPNKAIDGFVGGKKLEGLQWDYLLFVRFCYLWEEVFSSDAKSFLNNLVKNPLDFTLIRRLAKFTSLDNAVSIVLLDFLKSYLYYGEFNETALRNNMEGVVMVTTTKLNQIAMGSLSVMFFVFLLAMELAYFPSGYEGLKAISHVFLSYGLGLAFGDLFITWRYLDAAILVNELKGKKQYKTKYCLPLYRFLEQLKFIGKFPFWFINMRRKEKLGVVEQSSPFLTRAKEFVDLFTVFEDYMLVDCAINLPVAETVGKRVKI